MARPRHEADVAQARADRRDACGGVGHEPRIDAGRLLGAVLTGSAGALFSPAVESSLAREGGELQERGGPTRTEVFALFAIAGEIGAVTGPLLGAVLTG